MGDREWGGLHRLAWSRGRQLSWLRNCSSKCLCGRELWSCNGFPGKGKGEESLLVRGGSGLLKDKGDPPISTSDCPPSLELPQLCGCIHSMVRCDLWATFTPSADQWLGNQRQAHLTCSSVGRWKQPSQNHRMVGVGRDLCGSSSPVPLPKQGLLQQAAQDLV